MTCGEKIAVFPFFSFFLVCAKPLLSVSECLFFSPISVPLVFPLLISPSSSSSYSGFHTGFFVRGEGA